MAEKMPTKAQAHVLRMLSKGVGCSCYTGSWRLMMGACPGVTRSVQSCHWQGWIRITDAPLRALITDAGRAALERYEAKHGESSNA